MANTFYRNAFVVLSAIVLTLGVHVSIVNAQACGDLPEGCPAGYTCIHSGGGVGPEFFTCASDSSSPSLGCTTPDPSNSTQICTCYNPADSYVWSCTSRNITPDQCTQPQPNVGRACGCVFSGGDYVWDCGQEPVSEPLTFVPLANISGSPKLEDLYSDADGNLANYFGKIFTFAITMGGILAVLRIAWGGYLYMTTDLWSTKERAKEVLRETILGFILLLAVFLILKQINPKILEFNLNITPLPTTVAPSAPTPPKDFSSCTTSYGEIGIFDNKNGRCVGFSR